ncbi:hypothetical protein BJ508DRAFT_189550, partial [Ascobolus immersus RN42]
METGGGKTLLFFLPLKMQSARITIAIVPLIALMDDLAYRATSHGIEPLQFYEGLYYEDYVKLSGSKLIIVSQDAVHLPKFKKLAHKLHAEGRLDRIVIDEVHMTVTDQDFRVNLARIG